MANIQSILNLINKKGAQWMTVNSQPCMHTFIGDFYINLCLYNLNEKKVISVDVDDVHQGISDLLAEDVKEGETFFNDLYSIYSASKQSAKNIALQD